MNNRKKKSSDTPLIIFGVLIIVGIIANLIDVWVYNSYIGDQGFGLFSRVPFQVIWNYFKTYPGNLPTFLGLFPWLLVFTYLAIKLKIDQRKLKKELREEFKELGVSRRMNQT
ncbi:hypothetical protein D1BOALGB6SA_164 [Olavius sp. associated proteobacterium Delta 1]|nr:hypothetical protein D1BOALGB6SA_164 [Olavius sp. associated proteobacterium Delta 1]